MSQRKLNAFVRETAKQHGWDLWFTYNDKGVTRRRIKYMRNGFFPEQEVIEKIINIIREKVKSLREVEVDYYEGYRPGYSSYPAIVIKMPNDYNIPAEIFS